jgi:hypothetical protein
MDDLSNQDDAAFRPSVANERRARHDLRLIFPAACASLQPFFDPANQWAGHSHEHLALRTLKEQFPQLDAQDCFLVVTTAKRLFAQSGGAALPKQA